MEYDGFAPGFRPTFRPNGLDNMDSYVSVTELLSSPSKALKRSHFMDYDSSGQYLQGYSPSRKRSRDDLRRDSPTNFFGSSGIATYIAGISSSKDQSCDDSYLDSLLTSSGGPTPELTASIDAPGKSRNRADSSATQSSEFRSGCRGVSWNRRMKAWLAFWSEGKVRRSKTFNAKSLGFERARDAAIEFLVGKKAQLQSQGSKDANSMFMEDSQSGSVDCSSDEPADEPKVLTNLFDEDNCMLGSTVRSHWGMEEELQAPLRL